MTSGHLGWDATLKCVDFDKSAQMQRAFILEHKDKRMRSLCIIWWKCFKTHNTDMNKST